VAKEYKLQKILRDIIVCMDFIMFEVNVPVNFSGT
jgi:hypothetical protein